MHLVTYSRNQTQRHMGPVEAAPAPGVPSSLPPPQGTGALIGIWRGGGPGRVRVAAFSGLQLYGNGMGQ